MDIENLFVGCLAAYRGEHLILMQYPISAGFGGTLGLPQVQAFMHESNDTLKARLAPKLDNVRRGQCVRIRIVRKQMAFGEVIPAIAVDGSSEMPEFATVATCAFTGYFRDDCIAVKPDRLPEGLIPFHRPLIEEVETWRRQESLLQSDLESRLAAQLDFDPRKSSR